MTLKVKGHRLLVKPVDVKTRFQRHVPDSLAATGFQIALPKEQEQREELATSVGEVVAIGNTCWLAYDNTKPEWEPWCKVGDTITYARYAGKLLEDPHTGEKLFLINDVDVHCIVEA